MKITYSISMWNFSHYTAIPSLERAIQAARALGFGVELWRQWEDEKDLFDEVGRQRLKAILQGMPVSLHSATAKTLAEHQKQIDAAVCFGARIIVLHPADLIPAGQTALDADMARQAVACAREKGVTLALENGELAFLREAVERVDGLGICLDVGHVYLAKDRMASILEALKHRLVHLHLQDLPAAEEKALPFTATDHYLPGTGGIPRDDWALLARTLREIDFCGTAVFEIRPRTPFQTACRARQFADELF